MLNHKHFPKINGGAMRLNAYYGLGVGSGVGTSVPGPYWYFACQGI
jgi:hypothetical protein